MANFFEDTVNFGFGLFAFSREKIEKLVEAMVDSGRVAKKDAQNFMQEMIKKGEEQRREVKKMVKEEVTTTVEDMGINTDGVNKDELREMIREEISRALAEKED